ncbi:hypothetical protein WJX73_007070 [Symbiochloris irregularis]|uniref:Uncharacterized protein n=1 Tax=Symbiochloris irregularis TaxID=706552 RepID=A0AAW1P0T1_9CHLO
MAGETTRIDVPRATRQFAVDGQAVRHALNQREGSATDKTSAQVGKTEASQAQQRYDQQRYAQDETEAAKKSDQLHAGSHPAS